MSGRPRPGAASAGEHVVFWCWAAGIALGLATMIVVPLTGR